MKLNRQLITGRIGLALFAALFGTLMGCTTYVHQPTSSDTTASGEAKRSYRAYYE